MSKELKALLARKEALALNCASLLAQAQAPDNPTPEQQQACARATADFDAEVAALDKVNVELARYQRLQAALLESNEVVASFPGDGSAGSEPALSLSNGFKVARIGARHDTERPWASMGEFLQAVYHASVAPHDIDPRLFKAAATGLGETVSSDGGYLVQHDMATELLRRTYEMGAVLSRVRRIPVSGNARGLIINAVNETDRATGSRWGGIRAYWEEEAGTATASAPKFRKMELTLKKLIGLCYATDELLQDASALETVISEGFREEFTFQIEDAIINGNGSGVPLGILNSPSVVSITKETGQTATTLVANNIIKMWARMWARSRATAVFLYNQDIEPQLFTMSIPVGTGGIPVYMPANGLSQAPYGTLLGRPAIPVEYCATMGTVGDIICADLSQYVLIEKGGLQSAASVHVRFINDEMTYRFVLRVDGQPLWNAALTPFKGTSNTQSPFVAIATRA